MQFKNTAVKKSISILLIFSCVTLFAQSSSTLKGTIKIFNNGEMEIPLVQLLQNGNYTDYAAQTDIDGNFKIPNVRYGRYYLMVSTMVTPKHFYEIEIESWETLFSVTVPGACIVYNRKVCPFGHSNKLIPIIYGELTKRELRKMNKGKLRLGNTGHCERWHCIKHEIDF